MDMGRYAIETRDLLKESRRTKNKVQMEDGKGSRLQVMLWYEANGRGEEASPMFDTVVTLDKDNKNVFHSLTK